MSSLPRTYMIRPEPPKEVRAKLAGYSDHLTKLLYHRGISDKESAIEFLSPDYNMHLHDPFLMKDIDKASERLIRAIENQEHIVIFGDYDADGIPATTLMYDFLKSVGCEKVDVYIPHRHTEGFGFNIKAVNWAKEIGATLIVTVDCGVVDFEPVELANQFGIDVVITDHHEPQADLPKAFAVVDPKRSDCQYPEKILCGTGVAFKLVTAILSKNRFGLPIGYEKWLLDLVAIATLSDMVPLVGENRVLTTYGLIVLRKTRRAGISALLSIAGVNPRNIVEDDIAFSISPRINAASRMSDPRIAFELLIENDSVKAKNLAKELEKLNKNRKLIVARISKQARQVVENRYGKDIPAVLAFGDPTWMPSLLGLVCSSLVKEFDRPVFLWGREGGENIKGSCRSNGQVSVTDIMSEVSTEVLETFGGHSQAGGFVVKGDGVYNFEQEFIVAYQKMDSKNDSNQTGLIKNVSWLDREILASDVTINFIKELSTLSPFGVGNDKPTFLINNARIDQIRWFGNGACHLELKISCVTSRTGQFESKFSVEAVCFFARENNFSVSLIEGEILDIVGTVEMNNFMGANRPRIRIIDLGKHGTLVAE